MSFIPSPREALSIAEHCTEPWDEAVCQLLAREALRRWEERQRRRKNSEAAPGNAGFSASAEDMELPGE